MDKGIYLTVHDVQKLLGCGSYKTANVYHIAVRDGIGKKNSKKISVKDYCAYEELDFEYVWEFLRGKTKPPKQ